MQVLTNIRQRINNIARLLTYENGDNLNITAYEYEVQVIDKFPSLLAVLNSARPIASYHNYTREMVAEFTLMLFISEIGDIQAAKNEFTTLQIIDAVFAGYMSRTHLELVGNDGLASAPIDVALTNGLTGPIRYPRTSAAQYKGVEFSLTVPFIFQIERMY